MRSAVQKTPFTVLGAPWEHQPDTPLATSLEYPLPGHDLGPLETQQLFNGGRGKQPLDTGEPQTRPGDSGHRGSQLCQQNKN